MTTRVLEIRKNVLSKNDEAARALRSHLHARGILTLNLVSSPGAGKTRLLEELLRRMHTRGLRPAALTGDLATDNDARRIASSGAPVRQINTVNRCHLEAEMIREHLAAWNPGAFHFLFIENVGNLVCPSSYDLGEDIRLALLSVAEGEDKPLKYPTLFNSADVAVITKIDLAAACEFDEPAALANLNAVRAGIRVFRTSAKTGEGLDELIAFLTAERAARTPA
ncbi:MAG: hydrogenase nickel incorporation protein HypB [Bryobacteraceae bacterium]|nr:hydrogenase nickel incorporation protein HypB [Bryobacteraceae bacterium]